MTPTTDDLRPDLKYYIRNTYPETYFSDSTLYYVFSAIDTSASTDDTLFRIDVNYIGANETYPVAQKADSSYTNYYLGHCPNGVTNVPQYERLNYGSLYPFVDLIYSGDNSGLVMRYILRPGFCPDLIRAQYTGADSVKIITGGKLCVYSPLGNIVYEAPTAFNVDSSSNFNTINCEWHMANDSTVMFNFPNGYNQNLPVMVRVNKAYTPLSLTAIGNLEWSSFYGGGNGDQFCDVTTDNAGNVYCTGSSESPLFPVSSNVYQGLLSGYIDAVIVKFDSIAECKWATFFGSTGSEECVHNCIKDGFIYITGYTNGTDIPIENNNPGHCYVDSTFNGSWDVFIAKLDTAEANQLYWSTYYGGTGTEDNGITSQSEYVNNLVSDHENNLYILCKGDTNTPLKTQNHSYNNSTGGVLILKFNSDDSLVWATLYGESYYTSPGGIGVDEDDNVFITGVTKENAIPVVYYPGGYIDSTYNGGIFYYYDIFIAGFTGYDSLIWSTYYGGNDFEESLALNINSDNELIITGKTRSADFPCFYMGGNIYIDSTFSGYDDIFILKFRSYIRIWATLYGNSSYEQPTDITSDSDNNTYITGITDGNFPLCSLAYAYNQSANTETDAFILSFTSYDSLLWATYFGGGNSGFLDNDWATGIATFQNKKLYITGGTWSDNSNFPLKNLNPGFSWWQSYNAGNTDGFIARFGMIPILPVNLTNINADNNKLSIYPNPATDDLNVIFETNKSENVHISVYNIMGQAVYNEQIKTFAGKNFRKINISKYIDGIYMVNVIFSDRSITKKIIKK